MPKTKTSKQRRPPADPYRDFKDVYKSELEGEKIKVEDVLGKRVLIRRYLKHARSQFSSHPYYSVEIDCKGLKYFHTNSPSAGERLERIASSLPVYGTFVLRKSQGSQMDYLTIE